MPGAPETCELALPGSADDDAIVQALRARFAVREGVSRSADRTALDTADHRLRAKGLALDLERRRGGARLVLHGAGPRALSAEAPARPRYLAADLPVPIAEPLRDVIEVRALLPVVRLRTRTHAVDVLDDAEKTVVRTRVERARALRARGGDVELVPRLHLAGVLGYDKSFERVREALASDLGLAPAPQRLLDEAAAALGIDPGGIQTKIDVPLRAGVRADHAAVAVCAALAAVAQANVPGVLDDVDPEFLHDLRVSVRRTRSVLRELHGVFAPGDLEHFRTELKWVQAVTGPVRDLDVQLEEWPALIAELDPAQRARLDGLHALLRRRRAAALRRLRRDLRSARCEQAWLQWGELLSCDLGAEDERPDATTPIAALAGRRIRRVYARMVKLGGAIDATSPADDLHTLRKRGKELRYLLELFGQLWPEDVVKPMVGSLKRLQDVLGRHEDRHVQVDQLRALAPQIAAGRGGTDAVLALGMLTERLERDQDAARAELGARFAAFAARDQRKLVATTFRRKEAR